MKMRFVLQCLIVGVAVTCLTLLVAYPCCLNGNARGIPFALYLPRCEATFASMTLGKEDRSTHALDFARLTADTVLWGGLVLGLRHRLARRKSFSA